MFKLSKIQIMKPKISVVIPALNEEKLLPFCLQSLLNQNYPRDQYEIIVVDNGSTDKTSQIAESFGVAIYKYNGINTCGATRQFGTTKTQAPIIAFTDADSKVPHDWLSTIDTLFKDQNLVSVGGKILPDKNNFFLFCIYTFYDIFYLVNQFFHKTILWGLNFAVRKSAFDKVGGFNITLASSEDWDLAIRLQKKFGRKSVYYAKNLPVYSSIRKQRSVSIFARYAWDGIRNYINVVLLGNTQSSDIVNVR